MDEVFEDERFSHVFSDPRFRKLPRKVEKISIDKRFQPMFHDRSFKEKYLMDERGRELNVTSSHNLKKLYDIESESSEDDEDEESNEDDDKNEDDKNDEEEDEDEEDCEIKEKLKCEASNSQSNKVKKAAHQIKRVVKRSTKETEAQNRELFSESSDDEDLKTAILEQKAAERETESEKSSSDDSSDEDVLESSGTDSSDSSDEEEEVTHDWEEWGKENVEQTDEITKRLAVCNLDWSIISADDIYTAFTSFKPGDGFINSVKIYPSEFGKQRMAQENLSGPHELVEKKLDSEEEEEEEKELKDDEISLVNREKLRQYEISKLKYYYAVVDCDSPETANSLYDQLNGMEFENTAIMMDIRFIPDELTFDEEPHSVANEIPDQSKYKPVLFMNTALQQGKVKLTWDETDPKRKDILTKAFTEKYDLEQDIHDYLASSSSESDEDIIESTQHEEGDLSRKERIAKYRSLLLSLEDKKKEDDNEYEMEITWEPGLEEKTEELVKSKLESNPVSLTPFEEVVKKQKEKQKFRRKGKKLNEESGSESSLSDDSDNSFVSSNTNKSRTSKREVLTEQDKAKLANLALMTSDNVNIEDISVQKKSKKWKRKLSKLNKKSKEEEQKGMIDVEDPRFSAMYTSPLFSIDPSHPAYKARKGITTLVDAQQRKRNYSADAISKNTSNLKKRREL